MGNQERKPHARSSTLSTRLGDLLVLACPLVILIAAAWVMGANAQDDGPQCPPGFVFERMSGVGCVQEDCYSVGYFSYTGTCICPDNYSACYEPVDYSGFDAARCGPFCPQSVLKACVQPPQVCPADAAVESPPEESATGGLLPLPVASMLRQAGTLVSGPNAVPPTPARAAAAAAVATMALTTWLTVDWLRDKDLLSDIWREVKERAEALVKPVADGVKRQVARETGEQLAGRTADILDELSGPAETSGEAERPAEQAIAGNLTPAEARAKEGPAELSETDRLAEEFLRGGQAEGEAGGTTPVEIPPAPETTPLTSEFVNPRSSVFDGNDALVILKELGMLPLDTPEGARIPVTREELDDYVGPAPDGRPHKITLPSGRTIIVTQVEAIVFEGEEGAAPGKGQKAIDFKKGVAITAELVEEAPPATVPEVQPTEQSVWAQGPAPQEAVAREGEEVGAGPTEVEYETPERQMSQTTADRAAGGAEASEVQPGQSEATVDSSEAPDESQAEVPADRKPGAGLTDTENEELEDVLRQLREESERLTRWLRDNPVEDGSAPEDVPKLSGEADIIDGDDLSGPLDNF